MTMKRFENHKMLSAIKNANSILLCTHLSPDGDAIGSMLCMGQMLQSIGKHVTMVCHDIIPDKFKFLKCADEIMLPIAVKGRHFDLGFALDAGDLGRIGDSAEAFANTDIQIQIDHHGTNPRYCTYNEVDADAGATGCLVMRMAHALDISLTLEMAECLYTAISSDTGNFSYSCADSEVFSIISELLDCGLPLSKLSTRLHLMQEREHLMLLSRALASLHDIASGVATGMQLTYDDFIACNAKPEHGDKIVNYGLYLPGVKMTYLADEREKGKTKFSLRAQAPYDVAQIAVSFNGGGHQVAAGCTMNLPIEEATAEMEAAMLAYIKEMR